MALPSILPYTMPTASELPENKVSWSPDPKRAVLLIHDMQQYFVDAFTPGESPVNELVANISMLRKQCVEFGIPVVYTAQPGGQTLQQRGLLQDFWGAGINGGPYQKRIIEELAPEQQDIVLTKWRYSAFRKTNLLELLNGQGRDQLIVCGIYAHIGCLLTACDAFMQEVEPFFVADAVADFTLEHHRMAIKYAADRCAVATSMQQLLDKLRTAQDAADQADQALNEAVITTGEGGGAESGRAAGTADESAAASDEGKASASDSTQALAEDGSLPLTLDLIREQVAELLQESPAEVGDHDDLVHEKGLDSIRIMSLVERWRYTGAGITFVELAERPTLIDWWKLLSSRSLPALPNTDYFAWRRG